MKGVQTQVWITVAMVTFATVLLGMTVIFSNNFDDGIEVETVPVVEKRLESVLYTMSGLEEGYTTVRLDNTYGFERDSEGVFINYTGDLRLKPDDQDERKIDPPVEFRLKNQGLSEDICIYKRKGELIMSLGEC